MQAVEFETVVKDGHIAVPKEYQELDGRKVRVLVLLEEEREVEKDSFIERFVKHSLKVDSFTPMSRSDIHER